MMAFDYGPDYGPGNVFDRGGDWFTGGGGGGYFNPGPGLGTGGGGWPGGGFEPPTGVGGGGGGIKPPSQNQQLTVAVDRFEVMLKLNLAAWKSGGLTVTAGVATGWGIMDQMVVFCLQFGAAGQKTAAERDRRISPAMLRWDWAAYYIDPITSGTGGALPTPPPVPGGVGSGIGGAIGGGIGSGIGGAPFGGIDSSMLLLVAAVVIGAVLMRRK